MKHSDLPRLLLITALCLLFFLTKSMTIHLLAQCPLPGSVNLVQNFSFENIAPPPADCSFTSGQKNDAFNGCAANWVTGVGTPSLCNAITFYAGPGSSPIINAPEGIIFGCLGSSTSASGVCANESIVESVNLCQGVNYILSFQYNNLVKT